MTVKTKTQGRACVYRKTRTAGQKTKSYRARYTDGRGQQQDHLIVLANGARATDKSVAMQWLRETLVRVQRESVGLIDPLVESAGLLIRTVLARYVRHLRGNAGLKHIRQVVSYVKWIIAKAKIDRLADFNGEAIDSALRALSDAGRGTTTVNRYRTLCFGLGEWAVSVAHVLDRNPVASVKRRRQKEALRKIRRALTSDEAYRLLAVAGERRLYYALTLWTGLRVNEARALEWRDVLDLDGDRPAIALRAETTKSKRADTIPLHADLAAMLREAKPPSAGPVDRVFTTIPTLRTFRGGSYKARGRLVRRSGDLGCAWHTLP